MTELLRDIRYALRGLRREPGFALAAVVTLALGIGATSAVYTVVDRVLLRPLPWDNPERLVMVGHNNREGVDEYYISWETFSEMPAGVAELSGVAGVSPTWDFQVRAPGDPSQVNGYWVSATFLPMLGVEPILGRSFLPEEDVAGGAPVVLISHRLWQQRFGGSPDVVGRGITLGSSTATVIGVLPDGFRFLEEVDLWAPLAQNQLMPAGRQVRWIQAVARLQEGVTVERARLAVGAYMDRLAAAYPSENGGLGVALAQLHDLTVGGVRSALWILLGGVSFVLLIAVVNVGNLLLARATARQGEMAIRTALGAGRGRLVRQLLSESLLLGVLGGGGGVLLSIWLLDALRRFGPVDLPRLAEVQLDVRVLAVTAGITLASAVVFGLMPALAVARGHVASSLREVGRGTVGGRGRLRDALVTTEIALAMVLLVGAGLMIRSFETLMRVDAGFTADNVLTMQLGFPEGYNDAARRLAFMDELTADLQSIPGVETVGLGTRLPLGGQISTTLEVLDRPRPPSEMLGVQFRRASRGYFDALRIPLVAGRLFDERDRPGSPGVMILNASLAAQIWPGEDPIGKRVRFWFANMPPDAPWLEVVGIVADVRQASMDAPAAPSAWVPIHTFPPTSPWIVIRTAGPPLAIANTVGTRVRALAAGALVWDVGPMSALVDASVAGRRFNMLLLGLFAALALALAAVGIYGVTAYRVRRRTHEIGVRMALGADRQDVLRAVVGSGMRLTALGLGVGLVGALVLTRWMRALLFEVRPTDPAAYVSVAIVLATVAFVASWVPARRAAAISPMEALRHD